MKQVSGPLYPKVSRSKKMQKKSQHQATPLLKPLYRSVAY